MHVQQRREIYHVVFRYIQQRIDIFVMLLSLEVVGGEARQ